jgi:hypothetical protein
MKYVIAIPTHNRVELLKKCALQFVFHDLCIDPINVYVFVSDMEQLQQYKQAISTPVHFVVANTTTAKDKFNFIHNYFKNNLNVLVIEDDVKGFTKLLDIPSSVIIKRGFEEMHKAKKKIWGVYPSANRYFMRPTSHVGFLFIVANVYGFVADGDERVLVTQEAKTDYERTILYTIYKGGTMRLNYVAANTNNYKNKGGMQDLQNRYKVEEIACRNLVAQYPSMCAWKTNTASIYPEIKLLR